MTRPITAANINRIKQVGNWESISLLILLLIAMPLKYIWNEPIYVRWIGMIHGVLFIAYVAVVVKAHAQTQWPMSNTFWGIVASFVPFGPAIFVKKIERESQR